MDCHIPELMKFGKSSYTDIKNAIESIWPEKLINFAEATESSLMRLSWWCPFKIPDKKKTVLQLSVGIA